jgi:outer membrane immunogenic protein
MRQAEPITTEMMMTKWKMGAAAAAITVASAVAAQAADLPTRKAPPAPVYVPPPFTWTGFYIGVNGGGVWGTGSRETNFWADGFNYLTNYVPNSLGSNPGGWLLGGQAGFNYQAGAAVFGIETDLDWTSLGRNFSWYGPTFYIPGEAPIADSLYLNAKANLDWIGTTRARVGFVATPDNRLLIYGTGGIAYAGGSGSFHLYDADNFTYWNSNPSTSRVGWTLGAGVEYAVTNNWTIKGEYLYYNLGTTRSVAYPVFLNPNNFFNGTYASTKFTFDGSIFRVGLNYKF